jgi:hypothetical protein
MPEAKPEMARFTPDVEDVEGAPNADSTPNVEDNPELELTPDVEAIFSLLVFLPAFASGGAVSLCCVLNYYHQDSDGAERRPSW